MVGDGGGCFESILAAVISGYCSVQDSVYIYLGTYRCMMTYDAKRTKPLLLTVDSKGVLVAFYCLYLPFIRHINPGDLWMGG